MSDTYRAREGKTGRAHCFSGGRAASGMAVLLLAGLQVGCSKKTEPKRETAAAQASAVPSAAVPVRDPLQAAIPKFSLVHAFAKGVERFRIQDALILCEACKVDTKPRREPRPLFAFDGTTLTDLTTLLDDAKVSAATGSSVVGLVKPTHGGAYQVHGKWPSPLYLELSGEWDDDNIARNGSMWFSRLLKRTGNTWAQVDTENEERPDLFPQAAGLPKDLPAEFDDAMLRAPHLGNGEIPVAGGDGPLLVLGKQSVDFWDGHAFQQLPASWVNDGSVSSVARLATGYTLVATSSGLHVIGRDGKSQPYQWVGDAPPATPALVIVQKHLVLLGAVQDEVRLYRFDGDAPLAVAHQSRPRMQPQYSAKQPAGEQESIPGMVKFTDKCEQPFVVLFTPPNRGWDYRTLAGNLKGQGELQSHLTFFEYVKNSVVYFGAQADSEQNAQTLMTAYKERVPKAKPMLGCLNALGYLPNARTNKWDARVVGINLTVGVEL